MANPYRLPFITLSFRAPKGEEPQWLRAGARTDFSVSFPEPFPRPVPAISRREPVLVIIFHKTALHLQKGFVILTKSRRQNPAGKRKIKRFPQMPVVSPENP